MYISTSTLLRSRTITELSWLEADSIRLGGDSQLQRWSSFIGIITAIVGNILISFALNIQRYAHIKIEKERTQRREKSKYFLNASRNSYGTTDNTVDAADEGEEQRAEDALLRSFYSADTESPARLDKRDDGSTYLKSPYWWSGIFLMTVGEAGNFLAYGFAPASIVSPLGVVALISNCIIAPVMLKERFRLRDFWGVLIAVAGAATVVLSAKQKEVKLGPHEIIGAITKLEFEIYMAVTISFIGILIWASPKYGSRTILIDLGLVGLFGGYTALSTKGIASMLSSTLWRAVTTPITYCLLVVLIGTAIMQVRYVNKALQRFDSTQVIPVQFVMFTLSVIIGSAILYRDFEKATVESFAKFIGGCLLTFFGVFLITSGRPHADEDETEDLDGEEETLLLMDEEPSNGDHLYGASKNTNTSSRFDGQYNNGDSTNERPPSSRHSSQASQMDPFSRPQASRLYSSSSVQPSIRVVPTRTLPMGGEAGSDFSNPWTSQGDPPQDIQHPGMFSQISTPVLPSHAQLSSVSSLKPPTPRSATQQNIHTHPSQQQDPTPPQADRQYARSSMSRMLPGPFISPLSGGLSVVVADSIRRGVDSPLRNSRSLRRLRSGSQSGRHPSEQDDGPRPTSRTGDESAQSFSKSAGAGLSSTWSKGTRARSLSNTFGDIFWVRRNKSDRQGTDEDERAGPSGQ